MPCSVSRVIEYLNDAGFTLRKSGALGELLEIIPNSPEVGQMPLFLLCSKCEPSIGCNRALLVDAQAFPFTAQALAIREIEPLSSIGNDSRSLSSSFRLSLSFKLIT
jgi:hypothetical protein